jgi:hypothetical protein
MPSPQPQQTMKIKPRKSPKKSSEDLRVQVLRKTIPKAYHKHRASMVKVIYTRSMSFLDHLKKCQEIVAPNKKQKLEEFTPKKGKNETKSCKKVAMNIISRLSGNFERSGMRKIEGKNEMSAKLIYY